jgi:hypothetical protein
MADLRTDGFYERVDADNIHREYASISQDGGGDWWYSHHYQVWDQGVGTGSPREQAPATQFRYTTAEAARRALQVHADDPAWRHSSQAPKREEGSW